MKDTILAELKWEPSVNAAHIGVTTKDGVVSLMSHVETYVEKAAAEKAAGRVKGVKAIAEDIEVRLHPSTKHGDDDIATQAVNRLAWNSSVPKDIIKIKLKKGWVTLTGTVEWNGVGARIADRGYEVQLCTSSEFSHAVQVP